MNTSPIVINAVCAVLFVVGALIAKRPSSNEFSGPFGIVLALAGIIGALMFRLSAGEGR